MKLSTIKKIIFAVLSTALVITTVVCLSVDYILFRSLTWSLLPVTAMGLVWLVSMPILLPKKSYYLSGIILFFLGVVGYLYLIEWFVPFKGWVTTFALPILGVSAVYIIANVLLFTKTKINRYLCSAISLFMLLVLDYFVDFYLWLQFGIEPLMFSLITSGTVILVIIAVLVVKYFETKNKRR